MFKVEPLPQGAMPVYETASTYSVLRQGNWATDHLRADLLSTSKTICGNMITFPKLIQQSAPLGELEFPVCPVCLDLAKSQEIVEE